MEQSKPYSFAGRWALVGGASQGIGLATAQFLAHCGARVILLSRRLDHLEMIKEKLPEPKLHRTLAVDLERTEDVVSLLPKVLSEVENVSIWVNNTGGPKAGPLMDASPDEIERAVRGHLLSSQVILRSILPAMKAQKFGRIINVLSTSTRVPIPNLGVSNLTRAAMASWSKTLAGELGPFGITVNSILPGYTATPRLHSLIATQATKTGRAVGDIEAEWAESVPLKRFADPEETARAIAFLASDDARYITGVQLPVDGGRTGAL